MTEIKLEVTPQKVEDGWCVAYLTKLEVSVTMSPASYESRKVTATYELPEAAPLQVALPLFPGNGTQPENTLALQNVADQTQLMIQNLENAIQATIKKGDSW